MNLSDFNKTEFNGLYISKSEHESFGRKYIARFQVDKKRYVKVLGYTIKDNLTHVQAYKLLQQYKENISLEQISTVKKKRTSKNMKNQLNDKEVEEYNYLKTLLGDYQSIDQTTLQEGIQKIYDLNEMKNYQLELIKLQKHLEVHKKKMIILFEGRDASGKGGAIRRITRYMNNKHYRVVALGKPSETQKSQWFFQRYIEHFPSAGEIVLFDRSWYNRAMVEPIFGFCSKKEHEIFMEEVVNFENTLVKQDVILIKLYFSVSKAEQQKRFKRRMTDPLRQWKLSEVDLQAQDLWDEFSKKKYEMLKKTSTSFAPWHIVRSDNKHLARLEAVKIILNAIKYDNRNYSLDFSPNSGVNISVQKELARMRKKNDY
jgi:polyphosphate kinase 2